MTGGQIDLLGAPDVGGERDARDRYFTPPWAVRAFEDYCGRFFGGCIWEPCAGNGAIVDVLGERNPGRTLLRSDIFPGRDDIAPHDFLSDVDRWLTC